MKYLLIIAAILGSVISLSAQSAQDAITFGQQYHGGTARYMSMGGAFNALGGDFSTLSVNPAGIGIYRSNEFTFTGDLRFSNATTGTSDNVPLALDATSITETKSNFNLSNIGYVSGSDMGSSGLVRLNFGFGYNRLKDYHKAYTARINESAYSMTDMWAQNLSTNVYDEASTGAYLGNESHLLNYNGTNYESPLVAGATTDYIKDVLEEGRINEWVFSMGGNVNHVLYFGATIGIQDIDIRKEYFQTELFYDNPETGVSYRRYASPSSPIDSFQAYTSDEFTYYSEEITRGTGLNAKFGIIVKPLDFFRFGLAVHTPTINFMTVDHYGDITNWTAHYDEKGSFIDPSQGSSPSEAYERSSSEYRTVTPYKLHGSVAVILGKTLALDAEIDMIDYSSMRITDTDGGTYAYQEANNSIDEMYKVAYNARIGAELNLSRAFSLRAGTAYYGSPYQDNITYDANGDMSDAADYYGDRFDYSAGFGIKTGDFFLDLAYIHSVQNNRTVVFSDAIASNAYSASAGENYFYEMELAEKTNRFMMTMGFKF